MIFHSVNTGLNYPAWHSDQVLESHTCFYRLYFTLIWLFCFWLCLSRFYSMRSVLGKLFPFLNSKLINVYVNIFLKDFSIVKSQGIMVLCLSALLLFRNAANSNELICSFWISKLILENKSNITAKIVYRGNCKCSSSAISSIQVTT